MRNSLIIIAFFIIQQLTAQSFTFPQDYFFDIENQRNIGNDSLTNELHISLKPMINGDRIYGQRNDERFLKNKKIIGRKIFNENFLELTHTDYQSGWPRKFILHASPLFHFQGGVDLADTSREKLIMNSRGLLIKGNIDKKFYFESVFLENQATLPKYLDDFAQSKLVIPGAGRWKKFKTNGYDFAFASGFIAYHVNKHFTFQLGHGKHHLGSGYRSLLLSDNSFNYPYLRLNTSWWNGRIQYTSIYAVLMNLTSGNVSTPIGTEPLFQKKPAAFHHLSINVNKLLNFSFFQSIIWNKADVANKINISPAYFNPLIFSNLLLFGLQEQKNIMAGADVQFKPIKNLIIFGQFALDETGKRYSISNKYGWQVGFKYFDVFGLKNLYVSAEINTVRPFTYSSTDAGQSYSHYNQPLAHPLGANFRELVGIVNYNFRRIYLSMKLNVTEQGLDLGSNYGQDIFKSDYAPALNTQSQNQGISCETKIIDMRLGYLFNPKYNLTIFAGSLLREKNIAITDGKDKTKLFYLGIKTSLFNNYWDF